MDLLPIDMSVAFTAYLDGTYEPFHQFVNDSRTFIVLGKVPQPKTALFVLAPDTGAVHLMTPPDGTPEKLHSSYATFVEFLYRFAQFIEADEDLETRPARAEELERDLKAIDATPFDNEESPWNNAIRFLKTKFPLH
ncbi:hypothetical protein BJF79_06710 [Actinomadura sp. CNU-125]|uniref:SUKH-4 family immunity protein n=1 Tax=Actinomadura sp. CNU-125 TaxID=1904961 RepID=UPI000961BD10|nr:SUKH-4 family immunity protein [Actinomadura sp. CNU-125]OLT36295.1 hypothetical protein BJF79_06710 [Actinomadura sp. CNU-125]